MADYGVQTTGFVIKRLDDILVEQRAKAQEVFKDLVAPNDVVDTSDSTLLGRLINLDAVGDAFLWELGQAVYSAFDPNTATGIALDNLVAYGYVTRQKASQTTALCLFEGDLNTTIPIDSFVSDPTTAAKYRLTASTTLNLNKNAKITLTVNSVANSTVYSFQYANSGGNYSTVSYTSDSSATESEILNGLATAILGHATLVGTVVGNTLVIQRSVILQNTDWIIGSNLTVTKVGKIALTRADEYGAIPQVVGSITKIDTPVIGWDSVTNVVASSEGSFTESDESLRLRFRNSKFTKSINILDSLYSELLSVDGVTNVAVRENDTDIAVDIGDAVPYLLAPHSFIAIVLGGSPSDVAQTIWKNKPVGITSKGNTPITIYDSQGFPHEIRYELPNPRTIYVTIDLTTDPILYPADGAEQIKQAIIDYAVANFSVGDDVPASRLYTPINSIAGHEVNSLYIGTSASPTGSTTIPIEFNEIASFNPANIIITT